VEFTPSLDITRLPRCNPITVESSAATFMDALTRFPLRATIPTPATIHVVNAEAKPYMNRLNTIGTPVKSNFKLGYQGNGIFKPEYFRV
jgi:hypothetical protein